MSDKKLTEKKYKKYKGHKRWNVTEQVYNKYH